MIDMLVTLTKLDESSKLENASSVDIASLLNSSIEGFAPLTHFSFSISNYSENQKKGSYDILFDRFYRLDSSRNSETGGFGIGLSIAKAIVQKHGGEIKAFSPDGERMVFRLEI